MSSSKKDGSMSGRMINVVAPTSLIAGQRGPWARKLIKCSDSVISPLIVAAYRFTSLRRLCISLTRRLECGEMYSVALRRILKKFHGVTVGKYSYGSCMVPGVLPPGTLVGNYCSSADGLHIFRRNHPINFLSQHPFFYNSELGLIGQDTIDRIEDNPLSIGSDVWIGAGVTILPGCRSIGDGAIVGAGSVLTRDIPPFAVYAGNPARFIRERFSPEIRDMIAKSRWWELSLPELLVAGDLLFVPVTQSSLDDLLLRLEPSHVEFP